MLLPVKMSFIDQQINRYEDNLLRFSFDSFFEGYPYIVAFDNFGWRPNHKGLPLELRSLCLFIRFDKKPDLEEIYEIYNGKYINLRFYDFSMFTDEDWIKCGFDIKKEEK